jgi:predicted transcriptional regulator
MTIKMQVMTTLERKRKLKLQIDLSSEATLDKIEKILKNEKIELPQFIIDDIEKSREQYKNGEFLTEEEAEKDFEEWLKED